MNSSKEIIDGILSEDSISASAGLSDSSGTGNQQPCQEDERDEIEEVRKESRKDTIRVRIWRFAVTGAILATALTVTLATYNYLKNEEEEKFLTAFEQFSRTVSIAAIEQQKNLRLAYKGLADMLTSAAYVSNATWPFYTFPRFEEFAHSALSQSKTEMVNLVYLVKDQDRDAWLDYADTHYEVWMEEGYMIESHREGPEVYANFRKEGYHSYVTKSDGEGGFEQEIDKEYHFMSWNYSPPPFTYGFINWDFMSNPIYNEIITAAAHLKTDSLFTAVKSYVSAGTAFTPEEHAAKHSAKLADVQDDLPHSFLFHPVHAIPDDPESEMVAVLCAGIGWDASLLGILPDGVNGIIVVLQNTCNQSYTYRLDGKDAFFLGEGDRHDRKYDNMEVVVDLTLDSKPEFSTVDGNCMYSMHIYPADTFEKDWDDDSSKIFAIVISSTFLLIVATFFIYDLFVQRRNERLVVRAAKTSAIVTSLFPGAFRDKLMEKNEQEKNAAKHLQTFTNGVEAGSNGNNLITKPLADLFLESTILFADIVGFTAWSSSREPAQVFILLETLYSNFDKIAKNRRVFKVETVGDCFVAATGIPQPRHDHAVAMCRFAREMLHRMHILVKELEVTLGLGTADLDLRVGIHSGPVTGGILRGEKARFQLFGDTMNTTARMESNGAPGRIHISEDTAKILIENGKSKWVKKREGLVNAKGKGEVQTYWVVSSYGQRSTASASQFSEECSSNMSENPCIEVGLENSRSIIEERTARLVDWHVAILLSCLKQMVANRNAGSTPDSMDVEGIRRLEREALLRGDHVLEEVAEIIQLPEFDSKTAKAQKDTTEEEIGANVVEQLRNYVTCIAGMYRDNPFHNFDHASHVTMSVTKLLSRIVSPFNAFEAAEDGSGDDSSSLHDHTYGITSDPLTLVACAFSALIHDVDHPGVPNTQLVKECAPIAAVYNNRCVSEQNSLTLAWDLLMGDCFTDLRWTIYRTDAEFHRFRQLVVNSMMATDITDKQLTVVRNTRWQKAFSQSFQNEDLHDMVNRKATIVIEHLIQASDIAHTMQHWHVYRKWNERFFFECYKAYREGRADKDPSETWYKGELGFFDFYIIPLAKKLKECGVFGKASDEYLSYASQNRSEWEARGQQVVVEMVEKLRESVDWSSVEA